MIHFVGAGSGAVDLITVRGQKLLEEADIVVYAGSLVNPELLTVCQKDCQIYNSAKMTLEEVTEVMISGEKQGKKVVRLHTGDPCLYGAIKEQMDLLEKENISYKVCPGVSSFCGAASALNAEYTLPGISQSVVITRMAGRTPVPEKESIESFAAHQATMVIFLSTGMLEELSKRLIEGGYQPETPAAIVYKATWEDEKVCRCKVKDLAVTAKENGITKTALIVIGEVLGGEYERSLLYHPEFTTEFRQGKGKVYVIGLGPGAEKEMTYQASTALEKSEVIIGYTVYTGLIRERFPDKKYLSTPMRQEVVRCEMAMDEAMKGRTVAMVCSGDAGIYGMAGILLEIANEKKADVEIETVPGVTAASAAASILGAPLMHDFTIISLSDLMTPYSLIMKRVDCAGQGDFIVCLYNPKSKTGTGFGFTDYNAEGFLDAILAALDVYKKNPEEWKNLTAKGMRKNYSWKASSRKYEKLYSDL